MSKASAWPPPDDRGALAVLSRLVEPGDVAASRYVGALGAQEALARLIAGFDDTEGSAHWRVRLQDVRAGADLARMTQIGGRLIIPGDEEWPLVVDDLGDRRPLCLWARGPLDARTGLENAIAVVGSRAATAYGERCAGELASGIAEAGRTVVSGAAYGIDGAAHRGALAVGGTTVAVLACGVDRAYPKGHERLLESVIQRGLVVSEVPCGVAPTRWRFLQRNRLIAALARVTVVVEAGWRSGARSTAREAGELGRVVAAVPGPVTSALSTGCHRLLREGAVCVTDAREVLELASPVGEQLTLDALGPWAEHDGLSATEIRVLDAVPIGRPAALAALARVAGLEAGAVAIALGRLDLRGLVTPEGLGWRRVRVPNGEPT